MKTDSNTAELWKFGIGPALFEDQKVDERFWLLVALGRCVNALRFAQAPLAALLGDSPADQRTRYNSFFLTCALL